MPASSARANACTARPDARFVVTSLKDTASPWIVYERAYWPAHFNARGRGTAEIARRDGAELCKVHPKQAGRILARVTRRGDLLIRRPEERHVVRAAGGSGRCGLRSPGASTRRRRGTRFRLATPTRWKPPPPGQAIALGWRYLIEQSIEAGTRVALGDGFRRNRQPLLRCAHRGRTPQAACA